MCLLGAAGWIKADALPSTWNTSLSKPAANLAGAGAMYYFSSCASSGSRIGLAVAV